jgi:hypothetical protein
MFFLELPWLPGVFPTIGFRIITELCPTEDLPRLETNELSNKAASSAILLAIASSVSPLY